MQSSTDAPISPDFSEILAKIKEKNWWQGSLISGCDLSKISGGDYKDSKWWVIASQTCNLYNPCFQKVPVFEIIAANEIEKCDSGLIRGDNPRLLNIEAKSEEERISLNLDIQNRRWLSRKILSELPTPTFFVRDASKQSSTELNLLGKQWLDIFVGWLARSYTRITLPGAFNDAMRWSKLEDIFKNKLTKHKDDLYGIYLLLESDTDNQWNGVLGEMPPPYLLSITLVTETNGDPEQLKKELLKQLFTDEIKNPDDSSEMLTRAELAKKHNIRLSKEGIEAMSVEEVTLSMLKPLIRYSLVDHLSDSSMATP